MPQDWGLSVSGRIRSPSRTKGHPLYRPRDTRHPIRTGRASPEDDDTVALGRSSKHEAGRGHGSFCPRGKCDCETSVTSLPAPTGVAGYYRRTLRSERSGDLAKVTHRSAATPAGRRASLMAASTPLRSPPPSAAWSRVQTASLHGAGERGCGRGVRGSRRRGCPGGGHDRLPGQGAGAWGAAMRRGTPRPQRRWGASADSAKRVTFWSWTGRGSP